MRGFSFPLEALLRLRRRQEDAARAEYAHARRQVQSAQRALGAIQALQKQAHRQAREAVKRGQLEILPALSARMERLQNSEREAEQRLQAAQREESRKFLQLVKASQQRRVVERLRERQEAAFRAFWQRQQELADDELSTMRFNRRAA